MFASVPYYIYFCSFLFPFFSLWTYQRWKPQSFVLSIFLKMGHSRPLFLYFSSFQHTVDRKKCSNIYKFLLMTGFEPRTSGNRSDCPSNWATTTAFFFLFYSSYTSCFIGLSFCVCFTHSKSVLLCLSPPNVLLTLTFSSFLFHLWCHSSHRRRRRVVIINNNNNSNLLDLHSIDPRWQSSFQISLSPSNPHENDFLSVYPSTPSNFLCSYLRQSSYSRLLWLKLPFLLTCLLPSLPSISPYFASITFFLHLVSLWLSFHIRGMYYTFYDQFVVGNNAWHRFPV